MKRDKIIGCFLIGLLFVGCKENLDKKEEITSSKQAEEVSNLDLHCFKNENKYTNEEGTSLVDVETLQFKIEEDSVIGKFEWVPGEKGGISGDFRGTKNGNQITAVYNESYAEEPYPISIKIELSEEQAILTSTDESFGSYTIKKTICE